MAEDRFEASPSAAPGVEAADSFQSIRTARVPLHIPEPETRLQRLRRLSQASALAAHHLFQRESSVFASRACSRVVVALVLTIYVSLVTTSWMNPSHGGFQPPSSKQRPAYFVEEGSVRILDKHHRERIWHGVNVMYKIFPWYPPIREGFDVNLSFSDIDVDLLRRLGFNVIRLGIMWPGVEPEPGQVNRTYINEMLSIVRQLADAGIDTVLDFHQDVFSSRFCGEGVPSWLMTQVGSEEGAAESTAGVARATGSAAGVADSVNEESNSVTKAELVKGPTILQRGTEGAAITTSNSTCSSNSARGIRRVLMDPAYRQTAASGDSRGVSPHPGGNLQAEQVQDLPCIGYAVCMKPYEYAQSFPEPLSVPYVARVAEQRHAHASRGGDGSALERQRRQQQMHGVRGMSSGASEANEIRGISSRDSKRQLGGRDKATSALRPDARAPQYPGDPSESQCNHIVWHMYHFTYAVSRGFQDLYTNRWGWRDRLAGFWATVAAAFRHEPSVLGYELLNEPFVGDLFANPALMVPGVADKLNLVPFYEALQRAIREVDPLKLIMFEPLTFDDFVNGFREPPGGKAWSNLTLLAYHHYAPPNVAPRATFKQRLSEARRLQCGAMLTEFSLANYLPSGEASWGLQGTSTAVLGGARASPSLLLRQLGGPEQVMNLTGREAHEKVSAAVREVAQDLIDIQQRMQNMQGREEKEEVGEFGDQAYRWAEMEEVMDLADEHAQSWMAWEYKPYALLTGPNAGLFLANGSLHPRVQRSVVRSYPRAVAGRILTTRYDPLTATFSLSFLARAPPHTIAASFDCADRQWCTLSGWQTARRWFRSALLHVKRVAQSSMGRISGGNRQGTADVARMNDAGWTTEVYCCCCDGPTEIHVQPKGVKVVRTGSYGVLHLQHGREHVGKVVTLNISHSSPVRPAFHVM